MAYRVEINSFSEFFAPKFALDKTIYCLPQDPHNYTHSFNYVLKRIVRLLFRRLKTEFYEVNLKNQNQLRQFRDYNDYQLRDL